MDEFGSVGKMRHAKASLFIDGKPEGEMKINCCNCKKTKEKHQPGQWIFSTNAMAWMCDACMSGVPDYAHRIQGAARKLRHAQHLYNQRKITGLETQDTTIRPISPHGS